MCFNYSSEYSKLVNLKIIVRLTTQEPFFSFGFEIKFFLLLFEHVSMTQFSEFQLKLSYFWF